MEPYQKSLNQLYRELETSPQGLNSKQAWGRIARFGGNRLEKVTRSYWKQFFGQFAEIMVLILAVAGVIALVVGEPRDAIIIAAIILINAFIGFSQEHRAEKILAAFKKHLPDYAKVFREGKLKKILRERLVVGDIISLAAGDAVPADARLVELFALKTNDMALTGESAPREKRGYQIKETRHLTEIDNMVFMGETVLEGEGKAVVVATGMATELGKIAKQSQKIKEEKTPLQKELIHTGKIVAKVAGMAAALSLMILLLIGREIKESLLFAVAAGVAVVPEGLPAAVSVALSLGAERLLKKKALVKKLVHVESLGSVTVICTDKTGTLTTGKMTVIQTFPKTFSSSLQELFFRAMILCNNAHMENRGLGDPLELALLQFARKQRQEVETIAKQFPRVDELPFNAKRKMMSVVVKKGKEKLVFTKGAPLEVLSRTDISAKEKNVALAQVEIMAKTGLRVLALAWKKPKSKEKDYEKGLNFLGLVGIEDPPREEVAQAINLCRQAKIRVIMLTGDYGPTAKAIGEQIGLVKENIRIIDGARLHQMDNQKLKECLGKEVLFARIDPGQKLRIVSLLQEMGEVVAVTGDGVNDAPALVKADIGIAMGKSGTDVAKEAADMILLDDNFATIVKAIEEGRRIYDNAKKFVFYVFSSNSGELFAPLLGVLLGLPLPLLPIQILAIDLGTDVFPSLALGVEKEERGIMAQPPHSLKEKILDLKQLRQLLEIGLVMGILGLLNFLLVLNFISNSYSQATAAVYLTLVFCQLANILSLRSRSKNFLEIGLFSNLWLWGAELLSFAILFVLFAIPGVREIFHLALPSGIVWLAIVTSFFIFLAFSEWRKKKMLTKDPSSLKIAEQ